MSFKAQVGIAQFKSNLSWINELLDPSKVKAKISFWGGRVVTLEGHKDSVAINTLVGHLYDTIHSTSSEKDFEAAAALLPKLRQMYQKTLEEEKNLNLFSRLLLKIRSLFEWTYPSIDLLLDDFLPDFLNSDKIETQVRRSFNSGKQFQRLFFLLHNQTSFKIGLIFNPDGIAVKSDPFLNNSTDVAIVCSRHVPQELIDRLKEWIPENLSVSLVTNRSVNGQTPFVFLGLEPPIRSFRHLF